MQKKHLQYTHMVPYVIEIAKTILEIIKYLAAASTTKCKQIYLL